MTLLEIAPRAPLVDPWPGTPGGAYNAAWGESIRLFVQAGIASGTNWHIGPHSADRLDDGNVIGPVTEGEAGTAGRLWVDLACNATECTVVDGASASAGIMSRDEAATLDLTVFDPTRRFDPTNTDSPYWLADRSRLQAGTPIRVFAEVLDDTGTGVVHEDLFIGTTDRWTSPIQKDPGDRQVRITASGAIKNYAAQDYAEAAPVGAGDTTAQRLERIRTYFDLDGALEQVGAASSVTLQATTLAQSAWEMLNRTIDDELGYLHVLPDGTLRWWTRNVWTAPTPLPVVTVGCMHGVDAFDIVTDVPLSAAGDLLRNAVYASRSGGTQQVAKSATSIAAHGGIESALSRTDLGLADDAQVGGWAQELVTLFAFPEPGPIAVTMVPAIAGEVTGARWRAVLGVAFVSDTVRLVWEPHDDTASLDQVMRVTGAKHTITPDGWQVDWQTLPAQRLLGNVWHIGPHMLDRLDQGNVMGWTKTDTLFVEEASDAA